MGAAGTAIRGAGVHARATLTLAALACLISVGLISGAATAAAAPSPPLPGGRYVGETEKRIDRSIKVKVRGEGTRSTLTGYVRYRCGGIKAPLQSADGTFVAEQRGKGGKLLFKATGSFEKMSAVVGEVERLAKSLRRPGCGPAAFTAGLKNAPPIETKTISYGPFHTDPSGGHGEHGAGGGHNVPLGDLEKPCTDCHLVGILPDLREADGSRANFDTGSMLHHVVFSNTTEADATCANRNQRIFGAGNERSPILIPRGYGLPVSAADDWRLITHIMNMGMHAKPLTIEVTFYYVEGDALTDVTPFWFDIDNCGNSEYMTPAGRHTAAWEYRIPPRLDGEIVSVGGHLHDHGEQIKLVNATRDETICGGMAGYDTDPSYMGHIESIGGCIGRPVARLRAGDTVRLLSRYGAPEAIHDVMGIMFGYLAPTS
jgi:hypothetical protein